MRGTSDHRSIMLGNRFIQLGKLYTSTNCNRMPLTLRRPFGNKVIYNLDILNVMREDLQ
jgi:hypothetical protein